MPVVTIVLGLLLIAEGIGTYFYTHQVSLTALIPSGMGIPFLLLGLVALKERYLKHTMHAAAALGLLCLLAIAATLVTPALALAHGKTLHGNLLKSTLSKAVAVGLFAVFEVLCVRSFIAARRRRVAGPPTNAVQSP